jgi:DNA-binding SARP family transcriptional activator
VACAREGDGAASHAGAWVQLLGPVRFVTAAGRTIDLPSHSQRRLLAVLALSTGTTLRPDYLSELLALSPGALRTSVSRLRSRIGDEVVCTDAVGYRLTCSVDTDAFTSLLADDPAWPDRLSAIEDALALWQGEMLGEFRHEPWAEADVSRLDELWCTAIEDRAELLLARGRGGEAVAALEAHVATHSLRDRARGVLIESLASEGRQADALRAYQAYRAFLAEEVGTEPSAHVQSIERRVAAGWHEADRLRESARPEPPAPAPTQPPIDIPPDRLLAHEARLVGRALQSTALGAELALARTGTLRSVVLSGEAGIGKTTLLAAFERAHREPGDCTIVYGRCEEASPVPLQPFRSIVGTLVDCAPVSVLRAHCERRGGELQRIAPHLPSRVWSPAPFDGDSATQQHLLFEAIGDLIRRLAVDRPLVLLLDDLQWAEPTALLLLRHLGRALLDAPVLVVISHRDAGGHLSPDLRAAVADLERGQLRRIVLGGLDDNELNDLVASIVDAGFDPGTGLVAPLREETAGNPLYATQLVLHLLESGQLLIDDRILSLAAPLDRVTLPPSLVDLVWHRVHELGDLASVVLRAGSALGVEFREDVLVEIVDPSNEEVAASLDAAIDAGLLVDVGATARSLRFSHALVAHALYSELHGPGRRQLHERAARALEGEAVELPSETVVQLARHWALAGDLGSAQRWATEAGNRAMANLAPIEAAVWFRAALDHAEASDRPGAERAALMVQLGQAQHRAGDPSSRSTLLDAATLAGSAEAHGVLIDAVLANDRGFMRIGSPDDECLSAIEAALEVADPTDTSTVRLHALYAQELVHTPRTELRRQQAFLAIEQIERSEDPTLLPSVISGLIFALWGPGTLPLRRSLAERALDAARRTDDLLLQFWTSRAAYYVGIESAEPTMASVNLERLRAIADQVGEPRLRWVVEMLVTFEATMHASLDDAETASGRALELGMQIGDSDAFSIYAGQLFTMRSFAGRYAELLPLLEDTIRDNPDVLAFRLAHAISCATIGQTEGAHRLLLDAAGEAFAHVPSDYFWLTSIIGYAVLTIELEEAEAAAQLYSILEPYGDQVAFSGATSQGHISAYLGKLASLMGRHDLADGHLRRSLEVAVAFGWRYHEATTLVSLALSRRRRTGSLDDEAQARLGAAEAIAVECGLPIVERQVTSVRG